VKKKAPLVILLILLIGALGALIESRMVSDEERLDELFVEMVRALQAEDRGAMDQLIHPTFSFHGPKPVGDGDRDAAFASLGKYWDESSNTKLTSKREVEVTGNVGVITLTGHLRFDWDGGGLVLYKTAMSVAAVKTPDGTWQAQGITVSELNPGLF